MEKFILFPSYNQVLNFVFQLQSLSEIFQWLFCSLQKNEMIGISTVNTTYGNGFTDFHRTVTYFSYAVRSENSKSTLRKQRHYVGMAELLMFFRFYMRNSAL